MADMSWTWKISIAGLVLAVAGPIAYALLLKHPSIRSTAWPTFLLMIAGLGLTLFAAYQQPTKGKIATASTAGLVTAGFALVFFVLFRLPTADVGKIGTNLPDFELPNQDGKPIRLSSFHGQGPVFLVFYRGHW